MSRKVLLALACALVPIGVYLWVYLSYSMPSTAVLVDSETQGAILRHLRRALVGEQNQGQAPGGGIQLPGPVWIQVIERGQTLFNRRTNARDLSAGIKELDRALRLDAALQKLPLSRRSNARIQVDMLVAQREIFTGIPFFFAKSVIPGLDGIGLQVGERRAYILPGELFRRQLLADYQPFYFMHEFRTGLNLKAVVNSFADELDLSMEAWRNQRKRYFRFRTQTFVEGDGGRAQTFSRSRVPVAPPVTRAEVRGAVLRAADYVLRQIEPDGRFKYIYYPLDDQHSPPGDYSLPRHAGTTWFLSLAYRATGERRYKRGARSAIQYLGANAVPSACRRGPRACVGSDRSADLGSAALTVVAIAEYQAATGDRQYLPLARRLGRFIVWMQKPNGDFCHQYQPKERSKNCKDVLLYYSGEASLALAKLQVLTGDDAYVAPLQRALDFLTGEKYDNFMGQFFISEDHWTCIAAEAASEVKASGFVSREEYARFCYAFAAVNRRAQVQPGEGLMADLAGAFTITPFFMPHNTPVGSRTESNVATYLLSKRRGEAQPRILETVLLSIRYLVDQQIRPQGSHIYPNPQAAEGGMLQTPTRASIRIDYVQHAAAAMARALPLVPRGR
jgi:hypothetical protein